MEFASPITNLRTQLCIVMTGFDWSIDREMVWPAAAEEFLRKFNKLGIQVTIIGPRPARKFGSKKTLRFMDRHEVVSMKILTSSKSHKLEFRILNSRNRAWTRLRAEACIVVGVNGVWANDYEGWTSPGTLSLPALSRWVVEQKWIPGREFVFVGSSNSALRWASLLLDRGAKACFIVEQSHELKCWRSHRDRFISKGGRVLVSNTLQKFEGNQVFLANDQGTLILNADTVVLGQSNEDALNSPEFWKQGLYYLQRRTLAWELPTSRSDEEVHLESVDWRELYWRVLKHLDLVDYPQADGALKSIRVERRAMTQYRKTEFRRELKYSGKILDRESNLMIQTSHSVPRSFATDKPKASLECFENIACRACADACPENAIEITQVADQPKLIEDLCTGCGACVTVCPSGAAVMVKEMPVQQKARYFLPDDSKELWRTGKQVQMLNRKGDHLGIGRVVNSMSSEGGAHRIIEIESTNFNLWEARGYKVQNAQAAMANPENAANSPTLLKRGWVTLNGVRRLCPVDVPITVALWQLGIRRFEDALFCQDGSCQMCVVNVGDANGAARPMMACTTMVREGQSISFASTPKVPGNKPLCVCKSVVQENVENLRREGASETLVRELTGVGHGACHGRWCMNSCSMQTSLQDKASKEERLRPYFHGFSSSPWRDLRTSDLVEFRKCDTFDNDDSDDE